ncbi:MAG: RagB/SusD family nutrient uptake outer membrane protein [Alistipes sp.]|nr:RagB/SusD family nutrient uptake outer membrane protein [Alistipes sp.]
MKKFLKIFFLTAACVSLVSCEDYLDTTSPSNMDDTFATSSPSEALKIMSKAYATYRQGGAMFSLYDWNDPLRSDMEYYCEGPGPNTKYALMMSELSVPNINDMQGGFNGSYSVISYTDKFASIIAAKPEYQAAVEAGQVNDWTHLYGEAIGLWANTYFRLTLHFGDVPFGYENKSVTEYELSSRFAIYDALIAKLKEVEGGMYKIGEGGIDGERVSRTFVNALIGQIALHAAGYQTLRTDVEGLYGEMSFEKKAENTAAKCIYARPTNYKEYLAIAETYFTKAMGEAAGAAKLITTDERGYVNNPFQRHFQYSLDLQVSPETLFEIACPQGALPNGMSANGEYLYAFGRGSDGGGSNGAPCKLFSAVRMSPAGYWGVFSNDDPRRDVSAVVTGMDGKGNEIVTAFTPGNKGSKGGMCLNKWSFEYMSNPFVTKQRCAGINYPVMRMGEVYLMLAEAKAGLGKDGEALSLVNDIRRRAFGDSNHDLKGLTGDALKEAIMNEARLELFGESRLTWFQIRGGYISELAIDAQNIIKDICKDVREKGYYEFENGNQFPAYIWTKKVAGATLVYNGTEGDPVMWPAWRGTYDYATLGVSVSGTEHNLAIEGLFKAIQPDSAEAKALEADGYTKVDYGIVYANNEQSYLGTTMSGIKAKTDVPRYLMPIPFETLAQSKGKVTNGYGLPQQ